MDFLKQCSFIVNGTVKQKVEQKLEQMGKVQGVCLHPAHVLCMDAILNVGLEMGSHNQDCWPHVFRYRNQVALGQKMDFNRIQLLLPRARERNKCVCIHSWRCSSDAHRNTVN